jgi:hypothetical protein
MVCQTPRYRMKMKVSQIAPRSVSRGGESGRARISRGARCCARRFVSQSKRSNSVRLPSPPPHPPPPNEVARLPTRSQGRVQTSTLFSINAALI